MLIERKAWYEPVQWHQIREQVYPSNHILGQILDDLDPGPRLPLYKTIYPYGVKFVNKGKFYFPSENGSLISINDASHNKSIRKDLSYNVGSNPVCLILNKSVEISIDIDHISIPFALIPPGKVVSSWRMLSTAHAHQPPFLWDMTSGAKTTFLLPKISKSSSFQRMKKHFNLKSDMPKRLSDQWNIFREIANHPEYGADWNVELLYFSKYWFEKINDKKWRDFKLYLLQSAWDGSEYYRGQFTWDVLLSLIQKEKDLKPGAYIADTVRHIFGECVGGILGFAPAINNDSLPLELLQKAFLEYYRLDEYAPIIMQPCYFSLYQPCRPIYYSLNYPTVLEFSPKTREDASKIDELDKVKWLIDKYIEPIRDWPLNIDNTPFKDFTRLVDIDYIHSEISNYKGMIYSSAIPEFDPSFINSKYKFPSNASFFRGCIRISHR